MLTAAFLILAWIGLMVFISGLRGGPPSIRPRCPACFYDMSGSDSLKCPECGRTASSPGALHARARRPGRIRAGAAWLAITLLLAAWSTLGARWWTVLPRPILRAALREAAPVPAIAPGRVLPTPSPQPPWGAGEWGRLKWARQVGDAIDAWGRLVAALPENPSPAEIDRLIAAAEEVEPLYDQTGGLTGLTAWPAADAKRRIAERLSRARVQGHAAASAAPTGSLNRLRWALAELQFDGADYSHRPDWATVPNDLLLFLLASKAPHHRLFAISRIVRQQPEAQVLAAELRRLADDDPDPLVQRRAAEYLDWLRLGGDPRWSEPTPESEPPR